METVNTEHGEVVLPEAEPSTRPVRKRKRRRIALLWVLSLVLTAAVTYGVCLLVGTDEGGVLQSAMRIIRENFYFYDKDNDALLDGAIAGMAGSLDDVYSTYYTEEEYAALTKSNSGYYTGIGIVLQQTAEGTFEIMRVYPDTPAEEAGLMTGDLVTDINGVSGEGLDIGTFLTNMRSEDGGVNELAILRGEQRLTVSVTAREIYAPTVTHRMQTDSIGYIYLSGFHGECVTEVKEAIEELREQGMQSLIFDVRDNPGGSLYDVCDIADLFLPKGKVITSLHSRSGKEHDYTTSKEGFAFPMVLLINENAASASELLAGALKDHERAYLIGKQTFGKGIVQSYFLVPGTNGYIKITTEAYYTPNGVCIHGVGISPDLAAENPEEAAYYAVTNLPAEIDLQLQAAVKFLTERDG